jgi:hypothetical protein
MISTWILPAQSELPAHKTVDRVLIYYEGPQWVLLSSGEQKYVAYSADGDETESVTRWIEAPISSVAVRALCTGKMPLRDALLTSTTMVVDRNEAGVPVRMWRVPPENIPEDCLPDEAALLPGFARDPSLALVSTPNKASFACEGSAIRDSKMAFAALGALASTLQKLWSALADAVLPPSGPRQQWDVDTLAMASIRPGSFLIDVTTDSRETFSRIAAKYRDVVRAAYMSSDRLSSTISALDPRVHLAYHDYLKAIHLHRLDVFADWYDDGAFVGYERAERASAIIAPGRHVTDAEAREVDIAAIGFFNGWMTEKRRFEFFNIKTGEQYIGAVAKVTAAAWAKKPPVLGKTDQLYDAAVRMKIGPDGAPRYTLLRFVAKSA